MKNAWYKTKLAKAILVLLSILCSVTMVVSVLWVCVVSGAKRRAA